MIMNSPNERTTAPARRCPIGSLSHRLTELAVNPKARVNTVVNPRMNRRIGVIDSLRLRSTFWEPDTKATYPGTSGRTHGEAQEIVPAANASAGAHHRVARPQRARSSGSDPQVSMDVL